MSLEQGMVVAGYRIERQLGAGGMGVVYEATQLSLGRRVALKVLSSELSEDPAFHERFRREGRLQAAIRHRHIVTVFDSGESHAGLYIAMELVRGSNLKELIPRDGLIAERALRLLEPIASALDEAHRAKLIHRDVKPHNILVAEDDHPYLADFGITKMLEAPALTRPDENLGTLHYAAPEQLQAGDVSPASDVYALTAVLYESLTGDVPFPRDSEPAVIYAHFSDAPPAVTERRPDLGVAIDHVIRHGMAKEPAGRPATAGELMREAARALAPVVPTQHASAPAGPTRLASEVQLADTRRQQPEDRQVGPAMREGAVQDRSQLWPPRITATSDDTTTAASDGEAHRTAALPWWRQARRPLIVAAAGLVAIALAVVAARALLGGEPSALDAKSLSVTPITAGTEPTAIDVGLGSVWVTAYYDGREEVVLRIDPESTEVVGDPVPARTVGTNDLAVGEGAVWVVDERAGTVGRIDTGGDEPRLRQPVALEGGADDVAVGEGAVWVSNSTRETITKIDPEDGRVDGSPIEIPNGVRGELAVGEGGVWVISEAHGASDAKFTLTHIDPDSGEIEKDSIEAGTNADSNVVAGEGAVWVNDSPRSRFYEDVLMKIDPGRYEVEEKIELGTTAQGALRLATGADVVWVLSEGNDPQKDLVRRVDPSAEKVIGSTSVDAGGTIAVGEGAAWVTDPDGKVTRLGF